MVICITFFARISYNFDRAVSLPGCYGLVMLFCIIRCCLITSASLCFADKLSLDQKSSGTGVCDG